MWTTSFLGQTAVRQLMTTFNASARSATSAKGTHSIPNNQLQLATDRRFALPLNRAFGCLADGKRKGGVLLRGLGCREFLFDQPCWCHQSKSLRRLKPCTASRWSL